MPRLEAYRKQAKQLLRWHREGHYSIGGRMRGLPRYAHLTDAQALQLEFPLATAQEVIAREAGFESWSALKAAVGARLSLSPVQSVSPASIKAAVPVIFVSGVARAAEFFRDQLGFSIDFLHGHPAFYGGVSRNGVTLHLRFVHEPLITPELRQKEQLLAAFIAVENVKGLFEEYKLKGVPFVASLHKEPWGGPAFTVRDPDDNWICFCAG
jgi:catechol 2,3-dioxygenase-like lactoylglutathione lyase family enzyme